MVGSAIDAEKRRDALRLVENLSAAFDIPGHRLTLPAPQRMSPSLKDLKINHLHPNSDCCCIKDTQSDICDPTISMPLRKFSVFAFLA
jgi:hypothetical protein